ncbi:MAG: protein-S-isoprenylcysteine O-methyltransferase [Actinomycetota bacterium]
MNRVARILAPLLILAVIVGIVLRVDVNGWGSLVWIAMAAAMQVIRAPYAAETKDNEIVSRPNRSLENWLLGGVFLFSQPLPLVHLLTGVFGFADYDLPGWATALGAVGLLPGLWLFWRSHRDLGRNWSATTELRQDQELVTNGVYRRMRHPMYTSLFIVFALVPLLLHNVIAGFGGLVAFTILYLVRAPREEEMMIDEFGDDYRRYRGSTRRLLPLPMGSGG